MIYNYTKVKEKDSPDEKDELDNFFELSKSFQIFWDFFSII